VKDETAFLQPTQDVEAEDLPHPASRSSRKPYVPPTHADLVLFRPGARVSYQGQIYTVSHVILRRSELMVHLQETGSAVSAEKLYLEPTRIPLQRGAAV